MGGAWFVWNIEETARGAEWITKFATEDMGNLVVSRLGGLYYLWRRPRVEEF